MRQLPAPGSQAGSAFYRFEAPFTGRPATVARLRALPKKWARGPVHQSLGPMTELTGTSQVQGSIEIRLLDQHVAIVEGVQHRDQ